MKKFILLPVLLLVLTSSIYSQDTDRRKTGGRMMPGRASDSFAIKLQKIKESIEKTRDSIYWENNTKNITALMDDIDKRKKKDSSRGVLYIVFGAAMLGVLVFGLMRKKKKIV